MNFSPQQEKALSQVSTWLSGSSQQVFRLFGFAGTGKTTLAKHFAEGADRVLFACFTGKAAYVLQQKGCPASTIHSLIYIPRSKSTLRLAQLKERLKNTNADHPMYAKIEKQIKEEQENLVRPAFQLNLDSPLHEADLLIIDEVSMVNEEMGRDLEHFGCKILVLGDPAQLPPVFGGGYFIDHEPDIMLTEIHRQARDNPILKLATMLRNHEIPKLGTYGESSVIKRADMTSELVLGCDQLLVGRNKTRHNFNDRIRELKGFSGLPITGDRVVCLRNDHEIGILNGALFDVNQALVDPDDDMTIDLELTPEQGGNSITVNSHLAHFKHEKPEWWDIKKAQEFDYGYALTCHKSQGSEWDKVVVYDERLGHGTDQFKWLYTAVTRASKIVHLVR